MITSVCFLLIVASVPLLGGSLTKLGEIRLEKWWTILASLALQVVVISLLAGSIPASVSAGLHLLSYGLAFVFTWYNRHIVGMALIVFGGMLNFIVIAANGGVMPAKLEALQRAGIVSDSPTFENSAPIDDARLWFLGDIFALPEGMPFANVFSIGDILLVIGGGITVHVMCESKLGRARLSGLTGLFARGRSVPAATLSSSATLSTPSALSTPVRASEEPVEPLASAPVGLEPATTAPLSEAPCDAEHTRPAPVQVAALSHLFSIDNAPVVGAE